MAVWARTHHKAVVFHAHSTREDFENSYIGSNAAAGFFQKWITLCYSQGDCIITPSTYSAGLLESYGIRKPIHVLSNGIDTEFYSRKKEDREVFRTKYGYSEDEKIVMSVGLWIKRKGIMDFAALAQRMPQYQFIWFGQSDLHTVPGEIREIVESKLPKAGVAILAQRIAVMIVPYVLGTIAVISAVAMIVAAYLAVIYNSPLAIFFPLPDTGYENPRTVLTEYYKEFNQEVIRLEESGEIVTYQNTKNNVAVSNYNDTLMVYMVLYGNGKAGYVMGEQGKKNLKKVFDEMNYITTDSSTTEVECGDEIGEVWVTAYCACSQCCGPYANGITASGKIAKAKHTIAVDAYNPIVPMGTKVIIEGVEYTVEDTGNLNHYGNDFDIFYDNHAACSTWGRRHVKAYLAEGNSNRVMVTTSGTMVHNLTYQDYINKGTMSEDEKTLLTDMMDSDLWKKYYSSGAGQAVAELAMTKVGCHYDQNRRMEEGYYDCSSLVLRLYREVGIELPNVASAQGKYCYQNAMTINKEDLQPGDLIFYSYKKNGEFKNISHVATYVGGGKMVHAANEERGVVIDTLRTGSVVFYARPYQ